MSPWLPTDLSFHRRRSLSRSALFLFLVCCTLASTFYLGVWSSLSLSPAFSLGPLIPATESVDRISNEMSSDSASVNGNGNGSGSGEGSLPSLNSFLAGSKAAALKHLQGNNEDGRPLVMIMGNGAGDLDSLSSAISLAYLLTNYPHTSLPFASHLPPSEARFVPLIQTARSDTRLRPENVAIAAAAGIRDEDVLYLSDLTDPSSKGGLDLDLKEADVFSSSKNTYLGLVDHPQLELPWHGSSPRKVCILVDHHADAGKHTDASLRVFREPQGAADGKGNPTGSAQSVIIELFQKEIREKGMLRELSDLAMASILIDTDNLRRMPSGRASQTDMNATELLLPFSSFGATSSADQLRQALLQHAPEEVVSAASDFSSLSVSDSQDTASKTKGIWEILAASKNAVSHLTTLELLKRDYKTSSLSSSDIPESIASLFPSQELKAGFSSVNLGLPAWLHRGEGMGRESEKESRRAWDEWWRSLHQWMESQKLSVAVVGTSFSDEESEKHRRELILAFSPPPNFPDAARFFSSVTQYLESPSTSPLDLSAPWKGARLHSTGKKERVSGLRQGMTVGVEGVPQERIWAQVWRQQAVKANRKVYLPTIMSALQKAAKAV